MVCGVRDLVQSWSEQLSAMSADAAATGFTEAQLAQIGLLFRHLCDPDRGSVAPVRWRAVVHVLMTCSGHCGGCWRG